MGEQNKEQGSVRSRQIQSEAKITAKEIVKPIDAANEIRGTRADEVRDIIPDIPVEEKIPQKSPKVFISYSYDSDEHEKWVEDLATRLRSDDGVDIMLDKWDFRMGKPTGAQMNRAISEPDRVLCICTDEYVRRVDNEEGGAGYEGYLINTELVKDVRTDKFIPVIRNVKGGQKTPECLDGRGRVDLSDGPNYEIEYEKLLKDLYDVVVKPPLGKSRFAKGTPPVRKNLNEPPATDAEEDNLNHGIPLDHKPTWSTLLTSLDQETSDNRVASALSQSEQGVQLVKKSTSNMMNEAQRLLEDLKLDSIELTITRNSDKDLEIGGPEGRTLRFHLITEANNSLVGSGLFAEIIRLEGRGRDQPLERTEEMEFTPIIDSSGDVHWEHGDPKKPLDNSAVLALVFERFVKILEIDRSSRREKGFHW